MNKPKVLIACEESQAVTIEFRKLGIKAYSCDLEPCSGGHPEWHLQEDVLGVLNRGWDMMIAFPPCTYLSFVGNRWFNVERYGDAAVKRAADRREAFTFFMALMQSPIPKICLENPLGWANSHYRKPDQIINPWYFGDVAKKRTCLWLKNLPLLEYDLSDKTEPKPIHYFKNGPKKGKAIHFTESLGRNPDRARIRSKTFPGIAKAMTNAWGPLLMESS